MECQGSTVQRLQVFLKNPDTNRCKQHNLSCVLSCPIELCVHDSLELSATGNKFAPTEKAPQRAAAEDSLEESGTNSQAS